MPIAAPFVSRVMEIEKDWIDYNGHLNMAYYNVLFDRCSDDAFEAMGLGPGYAKERKLTIYTAEVHVCYVQELHLATRSRSPSSCSTMTTSGCAPTRKSTMSTAGCGNVGNTVAACRHDRAEGGALPRRHRRQDRSDAHRSCRLAVPERAGRAIGIKRKTA